MSYSLAVWQAILTTVYVADKIEMGELDFVPTSRVADDLGVPAPSMARLLRSLNRAGIIETREGARGGVRLAVPPQEILLLDILDAIEQRRSLFRTDSTPRVTGDTPARRQRAIHEALTAAELAMRASLEEVTINDISSA